jgi:hypothetical protein
MRAALAARALVCAFPCLAIAQVAVLQIKVTEGDGATHAAGTRNLRPLTVEITDETGRPVSGAAVSFRLPEEGPGGMFANGLRTDLVMTDANGRATVRNWQPNHTAGAFQVRITAAKEQARAGTLSRQYIAGPAAGREPAVKAKSGKKWIVVGLVAAAVAGGLGAGVAGRSTAAHAGPAPPTAPAVTIGPPLITVGGH